MVSIPSFQKNILKERFEEGKELIQAEIKRWICDQLEEYEEFYYLADEMCVDYCKCTSRNCYS